MAKVASHVLLVEGYADRDFFEQVCKLLGLNPTLQVATSKDFQGIRNTKEDIFKLLPNLFKQVEAGVIERLAVIVDADKVEHGSGYEKTFIKVKEIAERYGFTLVEQQVNGFCFCNNAGLADFGLWIMPNNLDEGMLEHFIKQCVRADEQALFDYAVQTLDMLPKPKKFKPHHDTKAEVATWLAWQKLPGQGLYGAIKDDLINTNHPLFKQLANWLNQIFHSNLSG